MDNIKQNHNLFVLIPCEKGEKSIIYKNREGIIEYRELVWFTKGMSLFIRELYNKHYSHESIVDECNKKWNKKWISQGNYLCQISDRVLQEKTDTSAHIDRLLNSLDKIFPESLSKK